MRHPLLFTLALTVLSCGESQKATLPPPTEQPKVLPSQVVIPKVLMFDGLGYGPDAYSEAQAVYWGQTIGVQGFFMNYVMASWEKSVGDDEAGPLYQRIKQFQETFSKHGVTDNFIKVALYDSFNWQDAGAEDRVVSNFRQAAHLAKFAGLKGLALDLEPYQPMWQEDAAIPDKGDRVYNLGKAIGAAIVSEYPRATVIVLPEILMQTDSRYALSSRFWDGLAQAHFRKLIIATEGSYNATAPQKVAQRVREKYHDNLLANGLDPASVPIALGLWPLGKSYFDKSARVTPDEFESRLRLTFEDAKNTGSPYVWIYGHGSAWQKDGPYGSGDVDSQFWEFVKVLQEVCGGR